MYGASIGKLRLDSSTDGSTWVTRWELSSDQGPGWKLARVDIDEPSVTFIRFWAMTGSDYLGDIAIDDVNVTARRTPAPTQSPAPSVSIAPIPSPSRAPTPIPSTVAITTEAQLRAAVASPGVVLLGADIALKKTLAITGVVGLILDGGGFTLDGGGLVRVLYIYGPGTAVTIKDLTVTRGYTATFGGTLIRIIADAP